MTPPAAGGAALRTRHAEAAPLRLPPAPRRLSGPARHPRAAAATPAVAPSLFLRLIDHPWLDRLVRGRAWIAIVATALLGIVAMQVVLLRLGAQIGSATATVNALTAQNETANTEIAALEANSRLGGTGNSLDMVYPAPGAVTYLQVNPGDAQRAVHTMTAPSGAAIAAADALRQSHAPASASNANASNATSSTPANTTPAVSTGATASSGAATTTLAAATGATSTAGATATTGAPATTTSTPATTPGTAATTPSTATTPAGAATTPASTIAGATSSAGAPSATPAGGTTPGP